MFDPMLAGFFDGSLEGHRRRVATRVGSDALLAAAHVVPEPFADRMWNLCFIAVDPGTQGTGSGTALLEHIEGELQALGESEARTLIVETSSTAKYGRTQQFYASRGFIEEARIRQFYGPEDDKLISTPVPVGDEHPADQLGPTTALDDRRARLQLPSDGRRSACRSRHRSRRSWQAGGPCRCAVA